MLTVLAPPLTGQTAIKDPMIPHGEHAVYSVKEGDLQYTYTEEVTVTRENTRSIYGFIYKAEGETVEIKVEKPTMIPFSSHTLTEGNGVSIDSSTHVTLHRRLSSDGVLVLSFSDLKYVLRGYPFDEAAEDLDIEFISTGIEDEEEAASFSVTIRNRGIESLTLNGRTINCHKLELRMSGSGIMTVLKPFIPKTYFWYSVESPHYLVAYEGSGGMPGSEKRLVEILDYSGWK